MKLINTHDIDALIARAAQSARQRLNLNLHERPEDPIQRLFIAAQRDSYFRVHRHVQNWEFFLVVRGQFDLLTFDDAGTVLQRATLSADGGALAYEIPANTWHTIVAAVDGSVF